MTRALTTAALLSLFLCLSTETLAAAPVLQDQLYVITSPRDNAEVRGSVDIIGTARLGPEFQFYKVEYAASATPDLWVVIGDIHRQEKTAERLETWHTTSLPDGTYYLHLVVVKQDGNLVETERLTVRVANTEPVATPTPSESPTPSPTIVVPTPTTAIVEQPTVIRASPSSAEGTAASPAATPDADTTLSIPSVDACVRQFFFGAFVTAVLFIFVGVVLLLRRYI